MIVGDDEVLDLEQHLAGIGRALFDAQQHAAADHQFGELLGAGLGWSCSVSTIAPWRMTDTSSVMAMISRSLWVIRMMVLPSSRRVREHAEQMVGLGGRQHAGGLVEDQDIGAAIERLQDFDALLLADREVLDDRIGIDVEAVFAWRGAAARARALSTLGREQRGVLGAENDVLETVKLSTSMKCWCTMPMPSARAWRNW